MFSTQCVNEKGSSLKIILRVDFFIEKHYTLMKKKLALNNRAARDGGEGLTYIKTNYHK